MSYYVSELLTHLDDHFSFVIILYCVCFNRLRGTELTVNVANKFQCMLGNKTRPLRVEVSPEIELASFRKDNNNGILYLLPPGYALQQPIKA